jgi:methylenetetrahydrofolate dehydrogenase (NADP+) / methenyltetrahydrofolate cyclohydrolase
MNGLVLDGKKLAAEIEEGIGKRVRIVEEHSGRTPVLATVLVGDDPASKTYVRMKGRACKRVGMESKKVILPDDSTTEDVIAVIERLNADPDVHGILLQHPVPGGVDEQACFERIALEKDVDGVTCLGFGRMTLGLSAYGSATPAGILTLLDHYEIELEGKDAVVVGRSPILGKPVAMMLLNRHATVTICHSRTRNLPDIVYRADIIVGAVGKPEFIHSDWIKPGAVLIDAGYNPGNIGDIDTKGAAAICGAYTPVPGGVGPMTIATLMEHTISAAERASGLTDPLG